jgi:hypothetical protein
MTLGTSHFILFLIFRFFDRLKINIRISHIFITTLFVAQRQGRNKPRNNNLK